jgi:polyisoprenoid-binding protein YceI
MLKKIELLLVLVGIAGMASAQYIPSEKESSISFKIKNFGFTVTGKFTGIGGRINFDPQNPTAGSFDITVDAATVNTDNSMRDKHLRGESYFDIANYPRIHFISTSVLTGADKETFLLTGQLTIKNKTREIKFPFTAVSANEGYLLKGSFKLNRRDFNVGGSSTISDELEVSVNVQAKKA